jgi:phosphoribosylanthranilate isomerase
MPTEVKICGLSDEEGVDAALDAGADFVGFVFFPRSPRNVTPERAAQLARRARGRARVVAVSVDADDALLAEIAEMLTPDLLQLHGGETPERTIAIRALTQRPVMKVVGIGAPADLDIAASYSAADRLLFDTRPPAQATRPGGHGMAFDRAILHGFACPQPWLLAGGLTPGNVVAALQASGAPGVDVSSGVESAPGKKNPDLIRAFVAAVRAFDQPGRRAVGRSRQDGVLA